MDRRTALEILDAAVVAVARDHEVAALVWVGLCTLHRWRRQFVGNGDGTDGRKGRLCLVSHSRFRSQKYSNARCLMPGP